MSVIQTHLEHIPSEPIVYMRRTGAYGPENYRLMQKMKNWIQEHGYWNEGGTIYAIAWNDAATTPPESCRYDACFVTDREVTDPAVLRSTLPGGPCLVYEILHTAEETRQFWTSIAELLAKKGVEMDGSRPHYGAVSVRPGRTRTL